MEALDLAQKALHEAAVISGRLRNVALKKEQEAAANGDARSLVWISASWNWLILSFLASVLEVHFLGHFWSWLLPFLGFCTSIPVVYVLWKGSIIGKDLFSELAAKIGTIAFGSACFDLVYSGNPLECLQIPPLLMLIFLVIVWCRRDMLKHQSETLRRQKMEALTWVEKILTASGELRRGIRTVPTRTTVFLEEETLLKDEVAFRLRKTLGNKPVSPVNLKSIMRLLQGDVDRLMAVLRGAQEFLAEVDKDPYLSRGNSGREENPDRADAHDPFGCCGT